MGAVLAVALPLTLTAMLPSFVALPAGEFQMPAPSHRAGGRVAARQSLVAFRAWQVDRRRIVRYDITAAEGNRNESQPVRDLQSALQQISAASLAATGRIPESVELSELEAAGRLSDATRRWLAGSHVSLESHNNRMRTEAGVTIRYVLVRVSFPNGSVFRMFYRIPPEPSGSGT